MKPTKNFIEKFLRYKNDIKDNRDSTISEYRTNLHLFFNYFIKERKWETSIDSLSLINIKSITKENIEDYLYNCKEKDNNGANTRRKKIAILKSFFNYMQKQLKLIEVNPTFELELPKKVKRLPKALNKLEAKLFLKTILDAHLENMERDYAIARTFLNIGLRVQELVDLNISSIGTDELKVVGKGNKERNVFINDKCRETLKNYLSKRQSINNNALFISENNTRLTKISVQVMIKKYFEKMGMPDKSVHCLRHTYGSMNIRSGVSLPVLQELMGHESVTTTSIYVKVDNEDKKRAASMMQI